MAFDMMAQMMALSSQLMGDFDRNMFGMIGGPDDDIMLGPGNGALMSLGGMGGGSSQMTVMMGGGGAGSGFMMSSVQRFDASDPSNNYERVQTAQFGPNGVMEARERLRDGGRGVEKLGLRRQLGEQYAQMERSRHLTTGEESCKKTVHNIEEDDIDRFDERWMAAASESLPTYSHMRTRNTAAIADTASSRPLLLEAPRQSSAVRHERSHERPAASHSRGSRTAAPAIPQYSVPQQSYYTHQPQYTTRPAMYQQSYVQPTMYQRPSGSYHY